MPSRREDTSPEPAPRVENNATHRNQPSVVAVAKTRPKDTVPYKTAETRPVKQNKILGYTGHTYKNPMVSHLRPPRPDDVMDEEVSERVENMGTINLTTKKQKPSIDAVLKSANTDFVPAPDIELPREKLKLTGTVPGYSGFSKMVPDTPEPTPAEADAGDAGNAANTTGASSRSLTRTQPLKRVGSAPSGPAASGYYVPTIQTRKSSAGKQESRFQIPGYTGHIKSGQFKFGNSYADTTRHILTKKENQTPGLIPPIANDDIGKDNRDLDGQYFKLPNKIKGGGLHGTGGAAKTGFMATIGPAPERLLVGTSKDPEPVVPWCARKTIARPVPADPERPCTVPSPKVIQGKWGKAEDPPIPVVSQDPEGDNRRRQAICGVRLKRSDAHKKSALATQSMPSKAERVRQQLEQSAKMSARAATKGPPPKKSANVKKREAERHAKLPELTQDIEPAAVGHLPGYQGHVPKEITSIEKTLAERSRRNFKNPFAVGMGTQNLEKLQATLSGTGALVGHAGAGTSAQELQHMNATLKNKPKSTFMTDKDHTTRRAHIPPGSEAARAIREGRTHYPLDPTIHTSADENIIVNGRGGYPQQPRADNVKTEERFHIPGYKGHVARAKFKYGNTWGDTTQHIMTKDKRPLTGDVPYNPHPGRPREGYGYLKNRNRIEPKKSMNSAEAAAALFTNSIDALGQTDPSKSKKDFRRVRQNLNA
eukprot:TRINITY_DN5061_c0_g1_i3.p1 TRINITY_DN5061_c0_g1~~TRINITY_DN5061_c0_g1_i3.p1  ORF type:complete len:710 (+),score=193.12 TRINITY_DN5061_c0_g1_i3:201-2330(+)